MRIAVVGSTGHTGKLLTAALEERGVEVVTCGRSGGARKVDVLDMTSVREALKDVDGVANVAGPFIPNGVNVADEAVRRGIPYVDTTGEQAYMMRLKDRHGKAKSPLVPALAYEYALSDLAVRAHMPEGGNALHVLYRHRGAQPSAGTKKTMLRVTANKALDYEQGKLVATRAAKHHYVFPTADGPRDALSFPGGEQLTIPQHTDFATIRTYFPTPPNRVRWTRAAAPLARVFLREPILRMMEKRVDKKHQAPENEAARSEIHLVAEGPSRRMILTMGDAYVVTAHLCAEGIMRLTKTTERGFLAPAQVLGAQETLSSLHRRLPDFNVTPPVSSAETRK